MCIWRRHVIGFLPPPEGGKYELAQLGTVSWLFYGRKSTYLAWMAQLAVATYVFASVDIANLMFLLGVPVLWTEFALAAQSN
jgi:hypothetical protein